MDLKLIADAATIVGSLSIFLTLIFIIIELKKSVDQTKLVNNANRDLLHSEWLHFWSYHQNAELVSRGRGNYIDLTTAEKFQFEQFIEQRIRLFVFALPTVQNETNLEFHYARARFLWPLRSNGLLPCIERATTTSPAVDKLYR